MKNYDLIVIGAGSGGYVTAIRAAQLGVTVALIEKEELGGTCLNRGCLPTKTMVRSAELLEDIKRAREFGIEIDSYKVNYAEIIRRKDRIVDELVQGIEFLLKKNKVDLIRGKASFTGKDCISVEKEGENEYRANNIVIATGSKPFLFSEFNYDGKNVVTTKEILEFTELPARIVIIGAGYIGCEFASILSTLGSEVTLIELMDEILPGVEKSTARKMRKVFSDKGVDVKTGTEVDFVEVKDNENVIVHLSNGEIIKTEKALVSVGRQPVTDGLGLDEIGVKIDEKGFIIVNERMETNIKGIYAVGDVTGKVMLAHVASAQGIVAAENIMGKDRIMDYRSIPSVIFTSPEIACTGLSYQEAREKGYKVKRGRFVYRANGKAKAIGEDEGIVTLISEKDTGCLLGGEIFGAEAENLIAEITLAVKNSLSAEDLASTIHAHPTLTEMIMEAAEDINGLSIHS